MPVEKQDRKRKIAVLFKPEDRLEYLTGMSKRKQARRKFGLDMQALKDYKAKLERRKEVELY